MTTHHLFQRPGGRTVVSFFAAAISELCDELCAWRREAGFSCAVSRLKDAGRAWAEFLPPYCTPPNSAIFVPTTSKWCAFVDNDRIGNMPYGELFSVSERLKVRAVSFMLDEMKGTKQTSRPYSVMFYHCDGTTGEAMSRSVAVVRDSGRWQFDETGSPLPFEERHLYTDKKKANRLTVDILRRYAFKLGIELDGNGPYYCYENATGVRWQLGKSVDVDQERAFLTEMWERARKDA